MTNKFAGFLSRLLISLPLLSLALGLIAWLRYGMDMPWFDDWRDYADGSMRSLELGHLFRPTNDTMSPVGFALDALALRYLDGNSVAYQFLSMAVVLGSLLILQWKLLSRVLDNTLHVAICFSFTVLMLQPESYWGLENVAYYQGLPLVFILGALWLTTQPGAHSAWHGPGVALLGLLAGFTYISGAFGAFAAGVALLAVATVCYSGDIRRRLMRHAAWFTAAAAVATIVQFYFSVFRFRSMHGGIPLAWPTQPGFWGFYLGKLARSLLLPPGWPWVSLAVTVLACAIAVACAFLLVRHAARPEGTGQDKSLAAIYVPLAAVIFVYLMLVSAGRTNFHPPEMQWAIEIFTWGFTRFHFFWAALIWPWTVAAIITLCRQTSWFGRIALRQVGVASVIILAALMFMGGGYAHMASQREIASAREPVAHCLLNELQMGGEVRCFGLVPSRPGDPSPDAYPAYLYAQKVGASFVRYFPLLLSAKRRETLSAPFYRMDGNTPKPRMHEMEALGNGSFRATGGDPQLFIQTNQPHITRHCATLDVEIEIKAAERDTAQLFFAPAGDSLEYQEAHSVGAVVGANPGAFQTLSFRLKSKVGFFESMRFDPVRTPQILDIREIRVYCVRELP